MTQVSPLRPWSSRILCHLAFWAGPLFAVPLFVLLHNVGELELDPLATATRAGLITLAACGMSLALTGIFSNANARRIDALLLAAAILMAVQGNLVHDLHGFSVFDGRPIDFRDNKALFWLEWLAWLGGAVLLYRLLTRIRRIPPWLPAVPLLSFFLLLAPVLWQPPQEGLERAEPQAVDPSVYDFSSVFNLVHLLPDGFQGDTARLALENDPRLAARFDGFTMFTDHLGLYPGTAPSLYTMLTGQAFPLERGFSYSWVGPETREHSYQAELARHGFQVDIVPISNYICPENANSCHPRPFKNTGYQLQVDRGRSHARRLLADLTLFRLAPLYLKEKIYDQGYWLVSDILAGDNAPVPDPILREWTERMRVVDDRPIYKWYHFVGTHVPPHWNAACELERGLERIPENYAAQAHCVLSGIADFIDRLRAEGVYEQTAIVISGDHGHNTVPVDQMSSPLNYSMYEPLLGTGRPALLVKPAGAGQPLEFNPRPTQLLNVTPTVRRLAGLDYEGESVFDVPETLGTARPFHHYSIGAFWSGAPVPYLEYEVGQPTNDAGRWELSDMVGYGSVPTAYDPVNKKTARRYVHGARLRSAIGQNRSSWVRGRQLAFPLEINGNPRAIEIELELRFADWMDGQSGSVQINRRNVLSDERLLDGRGTNEWFTWRIPVDGSDLRAGPNFVSVLFDRLHPEPGRPEDFAAAEVRSIRYSAH